MILFAGGGGPCVAGVCMVGGMHGRGVHSRGMRGWGRGHAWQGACMGGGHVKQERRPLQRTVRILLECILVIHNFHYFLELTSYDSGTGVYLHESRVAAESFITYLAVEHARVPLHVLREGPARLVELLAVLERKTNIKVEPLRSLFTAATSLLRLKTLVTWSTDIYYYSS